MIDLIQNIKAQIELFARFQAAVLDARSRPFSCAYAGIGDGALTEILRLKLTDFQHHKFIDSVIFEPKLKAAGIKAKDNDWSGWTKKGAELKTEFAEFFFEDPKNEKDSKIRLDTEVVLVGDESEPHVTREPKRNSAQLLHRLCVKLLRDAGELEYKNGRLEEFEEEYKKKGFSIVERHGSNKSLIPLLNLGSEKDPKSKYRALVNKAKVDDSSDPFTWFPNYGKGFLSNELMECHFEKSYEIGIALSGNNNEDKGKIEYILNKLAAKVKKPVTAAEDTEFDCDYGKFTLKLQEIPKVLYCFPNDSPLLTRFHVPDKFSHGLLLKTDKKKVLDMLLDDEKLPYHLYRVFLTDDFPKEDPNFALDQFVNTDTWVYLFDEKIEQRNITMICAEGMHMAHQILRLPLLAEVMGNRLPTRSVHGLGWAVRNTSKKNLESQRGNELLKR